MNTSHGQDSFSAPATGLNFPGETPNKVELKHFLESFQAAMDQKPYNGVVLDQTWHTNDFRPLI
eukprot:4880663-Pleurochrysis_carterae.AAC.1